VVSKISAPYAKRFEAVFLCTHNKRPKMIYKASTCRKATLMGYTKFPIQHRKIAETLHKPYIETL